MFDIDFLGRLKKIRISDRDSCRAVFEAVANAFEATASKGEDGEIKVKIFKVEKADLFGEKTLVLTGYEITDNGIGFDDHNMKQFQMSDTTHKTTGKGVGRLMWLHVFDRATIDSRYKVGKEWMRRSFVFSKKNKGISDGDTTPKASEERTGGTIITLHDPVSERIKYLPSTAESMAEKLLEHFLLKFTVHVGQKLYVEDAHTGESICVNESYSNSFEGRHKPVNLNVKGNTFTLHHLFIKPTKTRTNRITYFAGERAVEDTLISDIVPEIGNTVAVASDNYRYHGCVTGDYFDRNSDDERTMIKFAKDETDEDGEAGLYVETQECTIDINEKISRISLNKSIAACVRDYLSGHIEESRAGKRTKLENFVSKEQPQFLPYLDEAIKKIDDIPARMRKKEMELALYKAKIDNREETEKAVKEILASQPVHGQIEEVKRHLWEQIQKGTNAASVSALAEHVCARKSVIDVLRKHLLIRA